MGPDNIWVLIPLAAICLGIGKGIVNSVLQTYERVHMAKLEASRLSGRGTNDDTEGLRGEMAKLRDTTTQHAISLQHAVERLEQRVEFLERKTSTPATVETVAEPPPLQIIGQR